MCLRGASNEKAATQVASFVEEMVEAAGIEPGSKSRKSTKKKKSDP